MLLLHVQNAGRTLILWIRKWIGRWKDVAVTDDQKAIITTAMLVAAEKRGISEEKKEKEKEKEGKYIFSASMNLGRCWRKIRCEVLD